MLIEVCRPLLSKEYFSNLENSLFRFAYLKATFPKNHTLNGLYIVFWNFCLSLFSSKYFLSYLAGNLFWLRTCRVAIKVCEKSLFLVFFTPLCLKIHSFNVRASSLLRKSIVITPKSFIYCPAFYNSLFLFQRSKSGLTTAL